MPAEGTCLARIIKVNIDCLVQNYSDPIAYAQELLQSRTNLSTCLLQVSPFIGNFKYVCSRDIVIQNARWNFNKSHRTLYANISLQTNIMVALETIPSKLFSGKHTSGCRENIHENIIRWKGRWWISHQMGTFSTLLAFCAVNSLVTGEFPVQRPVKRSFDVVFFIYGLWRFDGFVVHFVGQCIWKIGNVVTAITVTCYSISEVYHNSEYGTCLQHS